MPVPLVDHIIAVIGFSLLASVGIVLYRRRAYRMFPWFFSYVVWHILQTLITEPISYTNGYDWTYFWTFWACQIPSLFFAFAVLYEVFTSVMEPYTSLNRVAKWLFALSVAGLAIFAALLFMLGSGPAANRLSYAIFTSLRSLRVIQVGLLVTLFLISRSVGLSWRSYTFGIALGYGIYAAVDLVLTAIRVEFGEGIWHMYSVISTSAFATMLVSWLWYILQPQDTGQPARVIPRNEIAKWNQVLEGMLSRTDN